MKKVYAILVVSALLIAGIAGYLILNTDDDGEGTYTISFDTAGGEEVDPINVTYGEKISGLPLSFKASYNLSGWYYEQNKIENGMEYLYDRDITVTAEWAENELITTGYAGFSVESYLPPETDICVDGPVPDEIVEKLEDKAGTEVNVLSITISGQGVVFQQEITIGVPTYQASKTTTLWISTYDGDIIVIDEAVSNNDGIFFFSAPCTEFYVAFVSEIQFKISLGSIEMNRTSMNLALNDISYLSAEVSPSNAIDRTLIWSSSDTSVIKTFGSTLQAIGIGSSTITASSSDGSVVATCDITVSEHKDVVQGTVYLDNGSTTVELFGEGNSFKAIVESALGSKGHYLAYGSNRSIKTVDGLQAGNREAWVQWVWAPEGWSVVSNTDKQEIYDGICIAITLSKRIEGKVVTYTNDVEAEFTAFFFIQFREDYNSNDYVLMVRSEAERREGFWIAGKGKDGPSAFEDAVYRFMFTGTYTEVEKEMILTLGSEELGIYGWIGTFCGLVDVSEGSLWRYWSQYTWNEDIGIWTYNDTALWGIDVSKYKYYAVIRHTTTEHDEMDLDSDVRPVDCQVYIE